MAIEPTTQPTAGSAWQAKQVYAMAVICLVVGLAIGYLFRGSQSPAAPAQPAATAQANAQPSAPAGGMGGHRPNLEEMKQMADKKAAPLVEKLKGDPNNSDLLIHGRGPLQSRRRLMVDHLLSGCRGVNLRAYRSSSRRLTRLSIHPKHSASQTESS